MATTISNPQFGSSNFAAFEQYINRQQSQSQTNLNDRSRLYSNTPNTTSNKLSTNQNLGITSGLNVIASKLDIIAEINNKMLTHLKQAMPVDYQLIDLQQRKETFDTLRELQIQQRQERKPLLEVIGNNKKFNEIATKLNITNSKELQKQISDMRVSFGDKLQRNITASENLHNQRILLEQQRARNLFKEEERVASIYGTIKNQIKENKELMEEDWRTGKSNVGIKPFIPGVMKGLKLKGIGGKIAGISGLLGGYLFGMESQLNPVTDQLINVFSPMLGGPAAILTTMVMGGMLNVIGKQIQYSKIGDKFADLNIVRMLKGESFGDIVSSRVEARKSDILEKTVKRVGVSYGAFKQVTTPAIRTQNYQMLTPQEKLIALTERLVDIQRDNLGFTIGMAGSLGAKNPFMNLKVDQITMTDRLGAMFESIPVIGDLLGAKKTGMLSGGLGLGLLSGLDATTMGMGTLGLGAGYLGYKGIKGIGKFLYGSKTGDDQTIKEKSGLFKTDQEKALIAQVETPNILLDIKYTLGNMWQTALDQLEMMGQDVSQQRKLASKYSTKTYFDSITGRVLDEQSMKEEDVRRKTLLQNIAKKEGKFGLFNWKKQSAMDQGAMLYHQLVAGRGGEFDTSQQELMDKYGKRSLWEKIGTSNINEKSVQKIGSTIISGSKIFGKGLKNTLDFLERDVNPFDQKESSGMASNADTLRYIGKKLENLLHSDDPLTAKVYRGIEKLIGYSLDKIENNIIPTQETAIKRLDRMDNTKTDIKTIGAVGLMGGYVGTILIKQLYSKIKDTKNDPNSYTKLLTIKNMIMSMSSEQLQKNKARISSAINNVSKFAKDKSFSATDLMLASMYVEDKGVQAFNSLKTSFVNNIQTFYDIIDNYKYKGVPEEFKNVGITAKDYKLYDQNAKIKNTIPIQDKKAIFIFGQKNDGELQPVYGHASGGSLPDGYSTVGEYGPEFAYKKGNRTQIIPMNQGVNARLEQMRKDKLAQLNERNDDKTAENTTMISEQSIEQTKILSKVYDKLGNLDIEGENDKKKGLLNRLKDRLFGGGIITNLKNLGIAGIVATGLYDMVKDVMEGFTKGNKEGGLVNGIWEGFKGLFQPAEVQSTWEVSKTVAKYATMGMGIGLIGGPVGVIGSGLIGAAVGLGVEGISYLIKSGKFNEITHNVSILGEDIVKKVSNMFSSIFSPVTNLYNSIISMDWEQWIYNKLPKQLTELLGWNPNLRNKVSIDKMANKMSNIDTKNADRYLAMSEETLSIKSTEDLSTDTQRSFYTDVGNIKRMSEEELASYVIDIDSKVQTSKGEDQEYNRRRFDVASRLYNIKYGKNISKLPQTQPTDFAIADKPTLVTPQKAGQIIPLKEFGGAIGKNSLNIFGESKESPVEAFMSNDLIKKLGSYIPTGEEASQVINDIKTNTSNLYNDTVNATSKGIDNILNIKLNNNQTLGEFIKDNEGLRLEQYKDSLGYPTIGYGHLIKPGENLVKITKEEADKLFEKDFIEHMEAAKKIPGFDLATPNQKAGLIDLTFNMGPKWYLPKSEGGKGFVNTAKSIAENDYNAVMNGLKNSKWYGQVKRRGPRILELLNPKNQDGIISSDNIKFDNIKQGAKNAYDTVTGKVSQGMQATKDYYNSENTQNKIDQGKAIAGDIYDQGKNYMNQGIQMGQDFLNDESVQQFGSDVYKNAMNLGKSGMQMLQTQMMNAEKFINDATGATAYNEKIDAKVRRLNPNRNRDLQQMMNKFVKSSDTSIGAGTNKLSGSIDDIFGSINNGIDTIIDKPSSMISNVSNKITGSINKVGGGIDNTVNNISKELIGIKNKFQQPIQDVQNRISGAVDKGQNIVSQTSNRIKEQMKGFQDIPDRISKTIAKGQDLRMFNTDEIKAQTQVDKMKMQQQEFKERNPESFIPAAQPTPSVPNTNSITQIQGDSTPKSINQDIFLLFNLANDEIISRIHSYAYGMTPISTLDSRAV